MADATKAENPRVRKPLTQERLRELLHYDPETGIWTFRVARPGVRAGARCGNIHPESGHRILRVDGRNLRSGRLAVLYMTREWPVHEVDHRDCNPANDRWSNLRPATSAENKHNRRANSNNTTGMKGVYRHGDRYRSQISHNHKSIHLGVFDNPQDARAAYASKARELFGEFARTE